MQEIFNQQKKEQKHIESWFIRKIEKIELLLLERQEPSLNYIIS